MDRFLFDMARYGGRALGDLGLWDDVGDSSDLVAIAGSELYVAAATNATPRRMMLHRGPTVSSDIGVQATIDRLKPKRSGNASIGLILLWKTSGCNPRATFLDGESDESGPVGQFACQPISDIEMGRANHLRVEVLPRSILIIERLEDVETLLWQSPVGPMHRRISLRAEHVDGVVTLWWNPDGIEEFLDPAIARVPTLLDGGARAGIFSHQDGRFLSTIVDYALEQEPQAPLLRSAEVPAADVRPVRATILGDLSRPSIQTGIMITPDRATMVPEAQQRESRVSLRDGRFLLRPGRSYGAIAWMRTVDGDMARGDASGFEIAGEPEDMRLRDDEGRLVLFDDEETPDGQLRSRRDYLQMPASLRSLLWVTDGTINPGAASMLDWHDSVPRGNRRAFTAPRQWTLNFDAVPNPQREELAKFFHACRARQKPFLWSHNLTGEHIMVRWQAPKITATGSQFMTFTGTVVMVEDLWAFYVPTPDVPETSSESDESSPTTAPGGPPCNDVVACQVPMWSRPDAGYGGTLGLAYDRDPDRTITEAADLALPEVIRIAFAAGEWTRDALRSVPGDLSALIGALAGNWDLEYSGVTTGKSRHWHHARFGGSGTPAWYMPNDGVDVVRHTYKLSKAYGSHTLEVRLSAEYNATTPDSNGAYGALLNVYVFSNELASFEDGGTVGGVAFTREDPAVWGLTAGGHSYDKFTHPQLAVCACVPTTFQAPMGYSWYPGNVLIDAQDQTGQDPNHNAVANTRASCFAAEIGSPWSIPDPGARYLTGLQGSPLGTLDRLNTVGTAGVNKASRHLQLIAPSQLAKAAAVWHSTKRMVLDGFDTTFTYDVSEVVSGGGEGIAFVIQNAGDAELGASGSGLGYEGISKSIAVEFDMQLDAAGDPSGNHISIHTNDLAANSADHVYSIGSVDVAPSLKQRRKVRITYTAGSPGTMRVYLDDVERLVASIDLSSVVGGSETAWVGFTASSGAGSMRLSLLDWTLTTSTAPTYGDANQAIGNSVFGYAMAPYGYGALTLGGGCPSSSLFEWLTVDDTPGIAALVASRPGWDSTRGGLSFADGSSASIEACLPPQPRIDCCGTVECAPPNPLTAFQCCIPRLSRYDLNITQLRIDETQTFDENGLVIEDRKFIGATYLRYEGLWADEIRYSEINHELRSYRWRAPRADPDYVYRSRAEAFDSGTLDNWAQLGSAIWTNTGEAASVSAVTGVTTLYATFPDAPSNVLRDGDVSMTILAVTGSQGALMRGSESDSRVGYFALMDLDNQTFSILCRYDDGFGNIRLKTIACVCEVADTGSVRAEIEGSLIKANNGMVSIEGHDCTIESGVFGLAATDQASFDTAQILDTGPDAVETTITLDATGYHLSLPAQAMPGYLHRNDCTGCNDCNGPFVSCTMTFTKAMAPPGIIGQPTSQDPYDGAHPPPPLCDRFEGDTCQCIFQTFVSVDARLYTGPWDDYVDVCEDPTDQKCMRFNFWTQDNCAGE